MQNFLLSEHKSLCSVVMVDLKKNSDLSGTRTHDGICLTTTPLWYVSQIVNYFENFGFGIIKIRQSKHILYGKTHVFYSLIKIPFYSMKNQLILLTHLFTLVRT
jgi:hypothetical protein